MGHDFEVFALLSHRECEKANQVMKIQSWLCKKILRMIRRKVIWWTILSCLGIWMRIYRSRGACKEISWPYKMKPCKNFFLLSETEPLSTGEPLFFNFWKRLNPLRVGCSREAWNKEPAASWDPHSRYSCTQRHCAPTCSADRSNVRCKSCGVSWDRRYYEQEAEGIECCTE